MLKSVTILLSLATLILILSSPAAACSCLGRSGKAALKESQVAFRGTVAKVDYLDPDTDQSEPRIVVTFLVSRVWKGPVRKKIVLHTIYNKYSCEGFYFQKGREYLVFAYANTESMAKRFLHVKNSLGTDICYGTKLIDAAGDYLREIGKGRKPR
ncbi:MAG: hypothetical protein ACREBG_20695 [Pyrinomonadaceae bacterium]